jgi:hypothetical protein
MGYRAIGHGHDSVCSLASREQDLQASFLP